LSFLFNLNLTLSLFVLSFLLLLLIPVQIKRNDKNLNYNINDILTSESISLMFFIILMMIYCLHPDLYGGEKPMDFSLLGHLNIVKKLPVEDPWAYGELLKYYYYSYFSFAAINKIINIPIHLLYPFALSLTYSLVSAVILCFFDNVSKLKLKIFAIFIIILGGHFYGPYLFLTSDSALAQSFFWDQTRLFNKYYFAEFTSWTYLFADLHPHVSSLPYSLCFLYLMLLYIRNSTKNLIHLLLVSLLLGALLVLNSWDFIIYSLITGVVFGRKFIFNKSNGKLLLKSLILIVSIAILSQLPSFFILSSGKPLAFGINSEFHGLLSQIIFLGISPIIFLLILYKNKTENSLIAFNSKSIFYVIFLLILTINIFFFMDPINTWFKTYTNIFILLLIFSIKELLNTNNKNLIYSFYIIGMISLFSGLLNIYAIRSYQLDKTLTPNLNGLKHINKYSPGEYAIINYLNSLSKENQVNERLISAYGKSFQSNTVRVSTFANIPTYLGWIGHLQVRGLGLGEVSRRVKVIDSIYQDTDAIGTYQKLKKIKATLVLIGPIEIMKYRKEGLQKFELYSEFFEKLISFKGTTLYRVKY
jgi:uncharacterized membrane protein